MIDLKQIEANSSPEHVEKIRQNLVQVAYSQQQNPLEWFIPTGAQYEWIKMIGNHDESKPRSKFFSGANKVLKTGATVACLGNIIWGPQNEWFDFPIFQDWPYPRTVWIDSEDSTLKEILLPEMHKWFPKGKYKTEAKGKTFDYHWKCQGKDNLEWNIFVKTFDTPAKKLESSLIGLMIFSEPPPRDHYYAIPARMPAGGMIWNEFTPLVDAAWFHDDLMGDVEIVESKMSEPDWWERGIGSNIETLRADAESACKEHGIRGIWDHRTIQLNIAAYDPEERDARAHGEFVHLKGRVFKTFDRDIHTVAPHKLSALTQYWFVIDPHERRYPLAKWYAIFHNDEYGHKYEIVYERPMYEPGRGFETITECSETIAELCAGYLKFEEEMGIAGKITNRIMDKQFGSKEYSESRRTVRDTYAKHGISCVFPQAFYIDVGHDAIKAALRCKATLARENQGMIMEHTDLSNVRDDPDLRIRTTCGNSVRAYMNYKFARQPKGTGKGLGIQVEEKFKDPIDNDRYFLTENPTYRWGWNPEQKGWRGRLARSRETEFQSSGSYF